MKRKKEKYSKDCIYFWDGKRFIPKTLFEGFPATGVWIVYSSGKGHDRWSGRRMCLLHELPQVDTYTLSRLHEKYDLACAALSDAMKGEYSLADMVSAVFTAISRNK
ncbi:MAG: hypothetical protein WC110_12425 [Bacteroidales bacterium]